ncbi:MAG: DnaD domain protein [Lachnospiraceae bacterium]|nr:DnaD domain protein [Lachnospiraceae bacterium]
MEGTIRLTNTRQDGKVHIPNSFIDNYLPRANGEFVKIYLYLIRWLPVRDHEVSLEAIADCFNMTESDVIRALRYWENEGLISLTFSDTDPGLMTAVCLHEVKNASARAPYARESSAAPVRRTAPVYSIDEIASLSDDPEGRELLEVIQQYMGRPLSQTDLNTIYFLSDDLGFTTELTGYLFEYCVSNGHTNMRYIEKTAVNWAEKGISTVEQAKAESGSFSAVVFPVMKAFGLGSRMPAPAETQYIRKWYDEYGFDSSMVIEAVNRTMERTHTPSFEYADKILLNWKKAGISSVEDAKKNDADFRGSRGSGKLRLASKGNGSRFHNFEQRPVNSELEMKLFNKARNKAAKAE